MRRIKRLIAVGASITANYQPCLQTNITKALEMEPMSRNAKHRNQTWLQRGLNMWQINNRVGST
jgi:hypothetical protein